MIGLGVRTNKIRSSSGATPPVFTVAPQISGTAVVGQTLTCDGGTVTGTAPITRNYDWYRGVTLVQSGASSTYVSVQADAGNTSNIKCAVTATNSVGSASADSNTVAQILDADLNTFLTAAAITDSTIKSAENTFFIARKNISALNNAIASYHLVTDAASNTDRLTQFKYNAYNPLNTDAAKRLVYSGTITANITGVQGSSNGLADTKINCLAEFPSTDFTVVLVSRSNIQGNWSEFGAVDGAASGLNLGLKWLDNNTYTAGLSTNASSGNVLTNTQGIFILKRSGTTVTLKRNNTTILTRTVSGSSIQNLNIYLLCRNFNNAGNAYSSREYSFFEFIKSALTTQQETDFYNALAAREAALGR